ncbi:MAG TPA: hypothetical protein VNX61_15560 [Rhizomicrobium sp.]|nr:hypothetical protein [Rhizomicrobium sp.]
MTGAIVGAVMHRKVRVPPCGKNARQMRHLPAISALPLLQRTFSERLKPLKNIVNSEIVRGRIITMAEYSDSEYVPEIKSTVYGVDSAIVLVVLAAAVFWLSIGAAVWFFIR